MTPKVKIKVYYKNGSYEEYTTYAYSVIDNTLQIEQDGWLFWICLDNVKNYEIKVIKE